MRSAMENGPYFENGQKYDQATAGHSCFYFFSCHSKSLSYRNRTLSRSVLSSACCCCWWSKTVVAPAPNVTYASSIISDDEALRWAAAPLEFNTLLPIVTSGSLSPVTSLSTSSSSLRPRFSGRLPLRLYGHVMYAANQQIALHDSSTTNK